MLLVAEAVTVAHVGRALALARLLQDAGCDVMLACDPAMDVFTAGAPFPVLPLASIGAAQFRAALERGRPVYTEAALLRYVADDLELLAQARPDVVIGDFRLSLSVSARRAGVPYGNVTNAYWSPYARPRFRVPPLRGTRRVTPLLSDPAFRLVRPLAFALHARPLNRVRRHHGLDPLPLDMRHAYCDGDLTLYADAPALVPVHRAPPTHRYVGPVLWSPRAQEPPWWREMLAGPSPIYVTLGSSGPAQLLPAIVDALSTLGPPLVVATAGRVQVTERPRVHVADWVPGEAVAAHACLVVCNGGSPTTQQALVHGVPVLGVPDNMDQLLNMHYVVRAGAGAMVRASRATPRRLHRAARAALADARMRARAAEAARALAEVDPRVAVPDAVRALVGSRAGATADEIR